MTNAATISPFSLLLENVRDRICFHSGRTDSSGGHNDYKNASGLGAYHFHHKEPPHLHPNGRCPYGGSLPPFDPKQSVNNGSQSNMCYTGDPVNTSTGDFFQSSVDIFVMGAFPITFKRFYNSTDDYNGTLGKNFRHSFDVFLKVDSDKEISLYNGDGRREIYMKVSDNEFKNKYNRLVMNDNGTWEILYTDKTVYAFDTNKRLSSIKDKNCNEIRLEYNDDLLSKIISISGSLVFSYNSNRRIESISDQVGNKVTYNYSIGRLVTFTNTEGYSTNYSYDGYDRLNKITSHKGVTIIANVYDINSRVITQTLANGGIISYSYDKQNKKTIYTEPNGNKKVYSYDENNRTIAISDSIGKEEFTYDDNDNLTSYIDKMGYLYQYEYDEFGNMIKETDPLGNVTEKIYEGTNLISVKNQNGEEIYRYDDMNNVIEHLAGDGKVTSFEYNSQGQPTKIIDPCLNEVTRCYDSRGNITSVCDQSGNINTFEYNYQNQMINQTTPLGYSTSYTYNSMGLVKCIINSEGDKYSFEYDSNGNVSKTVDFNGCETKYRYDNMNKLSEVENHLGAKHKYFYTKMNQLTSVTDPYDKVWQSVYDMSNRVTEFKDVEGNTTHFTYDANNNLLEVVEPRGTVLSYEYNALNRVTKSIDQLGNETCYEYNFLGSITRLTDACGGKTLYEYNNVNQLISVTDPCGSITRYTYNKADLLETITNPIGNTIYLEYSPTGKIAKKVGAEGEMYTYEYDADNRLTKMINPINGNTTFEYDSLGRLISEEKDLGHKKHYSYNKSGKLIEATDENNHTYHYEYDIIGNLIKVTDPKGNDVVYGYDLLNRLTSIEQFSGIDQETVAVLQSMPEFTINYIASKITRKFVYGNSLLGEEIDPNGDKVLYAYDENRNLIEKTDKDNTKIYYEYDLSNQLDEVFYPDESVQAYHRNALQQATEINDWAGRLILARDPMSRISAYTDRDKVVDYSYNNLGLKEKISYPTGYEVCYEYDKVGRIKLVRDNHGNETKYSYNELGYMTERILPNGVYTQYDYDVLGRLIALKHHGQSNDLWDSYTYQYDPGGNMVEMERRSYDDQGSEIPKFCYRFNYMYDQLNQLIEVAGNDVTVRRYFYDALGNRVIKQDFEKDEVTVSEYNALNQLTKSQTKKQSNEISEKVYEYDKRGNLSTIIADGVIESSFSFDSRNMLTQVTVTKGGNTHTANFIYNSLGNRIGAVYSINGVLVERSFLHDVTKLYQNVVVEFERDAQGQDFYTKHMLGNELIGTIKQGENVIETDQLFYQCDHLGSPIRISSKVTETSDVLGYDEFGMPFDKGKLNTVSEDGVTDKGFTGYTFEPVGDLYYAQARFYLPEISRFISLDKIDDLSKNRYGFCYNNPNSYVDLDGNIPTVIIGGLIGAGIGAGSEFISQATSGNGFDGGKIFIEGLAGAASGALAGSGVGLVPAIVGNAAIGASKSVSKDVYDIYQNNADINTSKIVSNAIFDATIGGLAGWFGGPGANAPKYINQITNVKYDILTKSAMPLLPTEVKRALITGMIRSGEVALVGLLPPYSKLKDTITDNIADFINGIIGLNKSPDSIPTISGNDKLIERLMLNDTIC